jgi:hypothetical protein
MPEEAEQQIRRALEQLNAATDLTLPTAGQVWSRSQFRLAYRPRRNAGAPHFGMLLAGLYVLALVLWTAWSGWSSIGLLTMVSFAALAACVFARSITRSFRS